MLKNMGGLTKGMAGLLNIADLLGGGEEKKEKKKGIIQGS
jgi:hypothetical protein